MKSFLKFALPLAVLVILMGSVWLYIFRQADRPLSKAPVHGVCFTVEADLPGGQGAGAIEDLKKAIGHRFSRFGTRIFLEPVTQTRFRVYIPILDKMALETASAIASQRGVLEFRVVHPNSKELLASNQRPDGYDLLEISHRLPFGTNYYSQSYLVSRTQEGGASGIHVQQAMALASGSPTGAYEIYFKLTPDSAKAFARITRDNVGRQLAIVMDGVLLSAPAIRAEIAGGAGVISGSYDRLQAVQLAILLETTLPVGVKLLETRSF